MENKPTQTNTEKQTKCAQRQARSLHFVQNILRPSSLNIFHYITRHVRLVRAAVAQIALRARFRSLPYATQTTDINVALA